MIRRIVALTSAIALTMTTLGVVNPRPAHARTPRGVDQLTAVGDLLFFTAEDGIHGNELWVSDGTAAGTTLVKDINPGPDGSNPFDLVAFDGALYLNASDGVHGGELWRSDGTEAGTTLVKDINPGTASAWLSGNGPSYTPVDGELFFAANEPVNGFELWKTDGTGAGTTLVKDILVGPGQGSVPSQLTAAGDTLFFTANAAGSIGRELWQSDGTDAGTTLVEDIWPGFAISGVPNSGVVSLFDALGDDLLFTARDGVHGIELWISDGTAAGTEMLADVNPGAADGMPSLLLPPGATNVKTVGTTGFFTPQSPAVGTELWSTDGTPGGTALVADINPGTASSSPRSPADADGVLAFTADDGTNGRELWGSDGTAAGTTLVRDINPTGSSVGAVTGTSFGVLDGIALFKADDGVAGQELWRTDGTEAGTTLVEDIDPIGSSAPAMLTAVDTPAGRLGFFTADDGTVGRELWVSDGTAGGTQLVKEIVPPAAPYVELTFTGKINYANEGYITSGDFDFVTDNDDRLTRVSGLATIPQAAGAGDATVSINVNKVTFFFLGFFIGNVRVSDPSVGLNQNTFQLVGNVSGGASFASGNAQWLAFDLSGLGTYRLNWSVS